MVIRKENLAFSNETYLGFLGVHDGYFIGIFGILIKGYGILRNLGILAIGN